MEVCCGLAAGFPIFGFLTFLITFLTTTVNVCMYILTFFKFTDLHPEVSKTIDYFS